MLPRQASSWALALRKHARLSSLPAISGQTGGSVNGDGGPPTPQPGQQRQWRQQGQAGSPEPYSPKFRPSYSTSGVTPPAADLEEGVVQGAKVVREKGRGLLCPVEGALCCCWLEPAPCVDLPAARLHLV